MKYDKLKIVQILNNCVNVPIQFSELSVAPSRTPDGKRCLESENHQANYIHAVDSLLTKYYRRIFGHIYYDPRNKNSDEVFSELFVTDPRNLPNSLNTESGYNLFKEQLLDKSKLEFRIVLSANKGAGKTFFFNYFLSKNNVELYDAGRIPFVVDFFRIYEDFRSDNNLHQSCDFSTYVALAYLTKTIMYQEHYPVLREFWEGGAIEYFVDAFNNHKLISEFFEAPEKFLNYSLEKISETIVEEESYFIPTDPENQNAELAKDIISTSSLMSDEIISKTALHFTTVLRKFLRQQGFSVILFLDGLDNLDYYRDHDIYHQVLSDIKDSLFHQRNTKRITNYYVLGVRPETYSQLKVLDKFFHKEREKFTLLHMDISLVLEARKNVAASPQSKPLMNRREECLDSAKKYNEIIYADLKDVSEEDRDDQSELDLSDMITEESIEVKNRIFAFERRFSMFCSNFVDRISSSIMNVYQFDPRYPITEIDYDRSENAYRRFVLEVLYNGNLRALLHNLININKSISLKPHAIKRPYLYREGQILNGLLYLNTEEAPFNFEL